MATKVSVDDLLESIGNLTLLEAADLKKKMEEKFGVTAAAPMAMMAAGPGAGAAARIPQPGPVQQAGPRRTFGPADDLVPASVALGQAR